MIFPVPTKFPIIIISSPRTGSNALAEYYWKHYNLKLFSEPDNKIVNKDWDVKPPGTYVDPQLESFLQFIEATNRYVVKLQSRNLLRFYPHKYIEQVCTQDAFRIKLQRKDVVAQIASFYIAQKRRNFYYDASTDWTLMAEYTQDIEIDECNIDEQITSINKYNNHSFSQLEKMNIKFDEELYYEDLGSIEITNSAKTPLPHNYDELLNAIRNRIEKGQQ
jgi:LPS sulfotransferase NodH